jgi:hypothetical protein
VVAEEGILAIGLDDRANNEEAANIAGKRKGHSETFKFLLKKL